MSVFLKFKPSVSQDASSYQLLCKPDETDIPLTKDNSTITVDISKPPVDIDGFCHVELNVISELQGLEGTYDMGIATVDTSGNVSSLLTTGLVDIQLDFLAPSPPSEASVYWN
jgi:hypothetical protein